VLPPAMLESYVQEWPTPTIANFRYMLRSGMMGWFTLMLDTTKWSSEQHAVAKEEFQLYKDRLRPLIRDANLYHVSQRPDGVNWDGIEYFDPARGTGVLYAFRGSTPHESKHMFKLEGLNPRQDYRLTFHDHSAGDRTLSGKELMEKGILLQLVSPNSSEIVFLDVESSASAAHWLSESSRIARSSGSAR
jgi:alpha-galactosidase